MYKVLEDFVDLQDSNRVYRAGEIYPRSGHTVSEARLVELLSASNRRGRPVIAMIEQPKPVEAPKPKEAEKAPAEDKKKPVRKAAKKTTTTRKKKSAD